MNTKKWPPCYHLPWVYVDVPSIDLDVDRLLLQLLALVTPSSAYNQSLLKSELLMDQNWPINCCLLYSWPIRKLAILQIKCKNFDKGVWLDFINCNWRGYPRFTKINKNNARYFEQSLFSFIKSNFTKPIPLKTLQAKAWLALTTARLFFHSIQISIAYRNYFQR